MQFLDHEKQPGQRGVERRRQPGTRAGRKQLRQVALRRAKQAGERLGNGRPHLYRRPFTTQRQPGPDAQDAADEFHRDQSSPVQCAAPG